MPVLICSKERGDVLTGSMMYGCDAWAAARNLRFDVLLVIKKLLKRVQWAQRSFKHTNIIPANIIAASEHPPRRRSVAENDDRSIGISANRWLFNKPCLLNTLLT